MRLILCCYKAEIYGLTDTIQYSPCILAKPIHIQYQLASLEYVVH